MATPDSPGGDRPVRVPRGARPVRRIGGRASNRGHDPDRGAHEGGFVAGSEALLLGCLVFVVGTFLVINAWGVVDSRLAADAVAREVARTLVEAGPDQSLSGDLRAVASATATTLGHGPVVLGFHDGDGVAVADPARLLQRCQRVTVTATLSTTTVRLPVVGGWGAPVATTGSHTEVVDPFRSGLDGVADCRG